MTEPVENLAARADAATPTCQISVAAPLAHGLRDRAAMRAIHRRLLIRVALATATTLAALAAGCGGDDASLVGTWRVVPHGAENPPTPVDQRDRWTFSDDGVFTAVTPTGTDSGTWTVDGNQLTITTTGTNASTTTMPFVLDSSGFLFGAATPTGSADGVVGVWRLQGVVDGTTLTVDLDIRSDNTFTYTADSGNGPTTYQGTWAETPPGYQLSITTPNGTVRINLFEHGGGLGGPLFEAI